MSELVLYRPEFVLFKRGPRFIMTLHNCCFNQAVQNKTSRCYIWKDYEPTLEWWELFRNLASTRQFKISVYNKSMLFQRRGLPSLFASVYIFNKKFTHKFNPLFPNR